MYLAASIAADRTTIRDIARGLDVAAERARLRGDTLASAELLRAREWLTLGRLTRDR
jgi:hypothetical protein